MTITTIGVPPQPMSAPPPPPPAPPWWQSPPSLWDATYPGMEAAQRKRTLSEKLECRMDWDRNPFAHLSIHQLTEHTVVLFIAVRGEAVVLEDDANLFPSDALVTKLRLLQNG